MNAFSEAQPGSPGDFIATARQAADLTAQDLADRTNLALQTVQRWERDETRPQKHTHPTVARALGISVDELRAGIRLVRGKRSGGRAHDQPQATVHRLHTTSGGEDAPRAEPPTEGSSDRDGADASAELSGTDPSDTHPSGTDSPGTGPTRATSNPSSETEAMRKAFFDAVIQGGIHDGHGASPAWVESTFATARALDIAWDPRELRCICKDDSTD